MRRGDIYEANLNPAVGSEQAGRRPAIVVSRDAINKSSPVVIVVPLTGAEHCTKIYPSQVLLSAATEGLSKKSVALGEQVRAINKTRLGQRLGSLNELDLHKLDVALKIALDLP